MVIRIQPQLNYHVQNLARPTPRDIEMGHPCTGDVNAMDIHLQHYVESKPKKMISDWWLPTNNHFVKLYVAIIICWILHDKFCWESYHRGNTWWRHQMITFAALMVICAGNSLVTGEFPAQRPVARSFDAFFDLRLNKRLSKQWWGWWFETLSRLL